MKPILRYILLTFGAMLLAVSAWGNNALQKHTYDYAIEGCDTLRLDHYVADVEGERPCVVFVFGGGFARGTRDKEMDMPYFEFLLGEGYDVVSIDYRLGMKGVNSPGVIDFFKLLDHSIDIAVEDLFRATNFILDHADEWQINREQIVVSGSSAGAITVLQGEYIISNSLPMSEVLPKGFNYAGVISFAGAIFSLDGAPRWGENTAPILLFHGNADRQVPYNKVALFGYGMYGSKYLAEKLQKADLPYWFYIVEYETHQMAGKPMYDNHAEIKLFIEEFAIKQRKLQRTTHIVDEAIPECQTRFFPTAYISATYDR